MKEPLAPKDQHILRWVGEVVGIVCFGELARVFIARARQDFAGDFAQHRLHLRTVRDRQEFLLPANVVIYPVRVVEA